MKVEKKPLEKSQIELAVELTVEEFNPYIKKGAIKVSEEVKIDGFRPGKVPYEILKQKIGEMTILEEAARIAIHSTIDQVIKDYAEGEPIGQPKVDITKIAPGNPLEFKIVLALLPEIRLGEYKELKIKQGRAEAKDEEVEKVLADIREMKAKEVIVSREIQGADKVIADIEMFLDKVPLDGGQTKDTAILMGKNYIVKGFDQKLLGAKKQETREFSLAYPDDFHMKNIAGKIVDFRVKVKEVFARELPEANDALAEGFGLKKIDELKDNIKKSILSQKKKETEQKAEKEMLDAIIRKSKFGDLAEVLLEHEASAMMSELEQAILQQGGKFEDYLISINKTRDQLMLELLPESVKRVKASLLIREIARKENIKVGAEEISAHVQEMIKHYKRDKEAAGKIDTEEYRDYAANVLNSRKVVNKLREWNIVEEKG